MAFLDKVDQAEPVVVYTFPDQDAFRRKDIQSVPRAGDVVMHNRRIYLVRSVTWNITYTELAVSVDCVTAPLSTE